MFVTLSVRGEVVPPDALVLGKTIAEWSVEWWKWVYSVPTSQNPLLDPDGSRAGNGQEGPVFFVQGGDGSLGRGVQTRSYSVPEGKYLLIPLQVFAADNIDTFPPLEPEELREALAGLLSRVTELHASIDGIAITNLFSHRAQAPLFSVIFFQEDNINTFFYGHPILGLVDPIVADGYWLLLKPLPPGTHVLNFGATRRFSGSYDRTDTITVVPAPLEEQVNKLIAQVVQANLPRTIEGTLNVSLGAAQASFASGRVRAGLNQLRAFQHKVAAQVGRTRPRLAGELIEAGQEIINRTRMEAN